MCFKLKSPGTGPKDLSMHTWIACVRAVGPAAGEAQRLLAVVPGDGGVDLPDDAAEARLPIASNLSHPLNHIVMGLRLRAVHLRFSSQTTGLKPARDRPILSVPLCLRRHGTYSSGS